ELMRQAMDGYFLDGLLAALHDAYRVQRTIMDPAVAADPQRLAGFLRGRPRLEAVLDVVHRTHGATALGRLGANFRHREPNRLHRLLAAHLAAGGSQATANFDRWIEACLGTPADEARLLHFHGEVDPTGHAEMLPFGALLGELEFGFRTDERDRLIRTLTGAGRRATAWIGYSFSDYFDVTPAVVEAIEEGRFAGHTMLWFDFSPSAPEVTNLGAATAVPEILRTAERHGARVERIAGWSGDALATLLEELGCDIDVAWRRPDPCPGCSPARPVAAPSDERIRREATVRLLARFDMGGRVSDDESFLGLRVRDLADAYQPEYWWKKGEYERGRAAALALLDPEQPWHDVRALLVDSRFDWIEGRLGRAGRRAVRAIRLMDAGSDPPFDVCVEALERFGRIAVHMARSPDTRRLPLQRLLRRLPDYPSRVAALREAIDATMRGRARGLENLVASESVRHLDDALENYRREIVAGARHRPTTTTDDAAATLARTRSRTIERFEQSESISSLLNYVHGNANIGFWDFPIADGLDWQRPMAELYATVGNVADIHRTALMTPYAHRPPSIAEAWHAGRSLDVSGWHRMRMWALWGANRFRTHRAHARRSSYPRSG
ncbi:MAG: hypothetical protein WC558_13335, partial [Patulibacter sp.]